jgi:hypothetical protein
MWLVLLGYGAVVAALALVLHLHASAAVGAVVWGLLALLLGFEAATLRRFTLGRRGYRNIGIVVGDDRELAERRFFDSWIRNPRGEPGAPSGASSVPAPNPRMGSAASDVLGLFPEPGGGP